jgi:hypothetical protein
MAWLVLTRPSSLKPLALMYTRLAGVIMPAQSSAGACASAMLPSSSRTSAT